MAIIPLTKVVTSRDREPMERLVLDNVHPGATVATDEFGSYRRLDALGFDHVTVQHKKGNTRPRTVVASTRSKASGRS